MRTVLLFLILIAFTSCVKKEKEFILLGFEKDLIPEGVAIDSVSQTIFLNSLRHNKIVTCHIDGTNPKDFIESNQYGYLPGFGMTVKGDTLFALGNSLPKLNSRSILLLLNTKTGNLIRSYSPADTTFRYLNDLVVCRNGDIFITDSESNKIFVVTHAREVLEVYMESDEIAHSNGITMSSDEKYLYVASHTKGIRVVERATKRILNEVNPEHGGIDGMKYYKNSLIAIVNAKKLKNDNGVYRFFLNKEGTSVIRKEKIISFHDNFKLPTTFAILDGYLYFTINSQIDNFNDTSNQIIDNNKLEEYQMMKFKLE